MRLIGHEGDHDEEPRRKNLDREAHFGFTLRSKQSVQKIEEMNGPSERFPMRLDTSKTSLHVGEHHESDLNQCHL